MSFDAFLNQTCVIERPVMTITKDRYNNSTYSNAIVFSDVRCRLIEKSVKLLDERTSEYTWVKASVLLLPPDVTVLPKDEVTLSGVTYVVKQPLPRTRTNARHHVSVVVEVLNG